MGTIKSSILSAIGFFIPTFILLTALNFVNLPAVGSMVDGLLFSLYFTAVFFGSMYGSSWALQVKTVKAPKSFINIVIGAIMGDVAWAVISILWLLPIMRDTYIMVLNAIFINSLIIFFCGIATNVLNFGRLHKPVVE